MQAHQMILRPRRNTTKRGGNRNTRTADSRRGLEKARLLNLQLSYPGQPHAELWLEAVPEILLTAVTTGVIDVSYPIDISVIQSFATRFESTFVEYRIVSAVFETRGFSSLNSGLLNQWFDEKVGAAPTQAEATEKALQAFPLSDQVNTHLQKWNPTDLLDLQFTPISTTNTVAWFKSYTDNAVFGAPITSTSVGIVVPRFLFQFRELKGV
jgi:hypothetical protein